MKNATSYSDGLLELKSGSGAEGRLNQKVDLTNYKYIKVNALFAAAEYSTSTAMIKSGYYMIIVNTDASSIDNKTKSTTITTSASGYSTDILDVSSLTGSYYIWIAPLYYELNGAKVTGYVRVRQIFLSNT